MRSITTAHSTRSPRNLGRTTPRLTAPTWCPARPMRCSPAATEGGDSTWATRSTAPMSMPSSSELVATTAGRRPALRSSSMTLRCSRLTEPWWARASPPPAISLRRAQTRSASRRELANTIVERCPRTSSTRRSSMCGQMLARAGAPAAEPRRGSPASSPIAAMSSTGTSTDSSNALAAGGATTVTGRAPAGPPGSVPVPGVGPAGAWPPRKRAASSSGRTVADSPIRCARGRPYPRSWSRRSRLSARCAPRLVATSEWTSSTITVSTAASASRAWDVSSRNRDSGVVMRMSGGVRAKRRRSSAGVSPVRIATEISGSGAPAPAAAARRPASGERRLRSMSAASALSGETYSTRRRSRAGTGGAAASRSIADRNAASVLPEPVGATTRTSRRSPIGGQPPACAGVGVAKVASNHARVSGEKPPRGSPAAGGRSSGCITPCYGRAGTGGAGGRTRAGAGRAGARPAGTRPRDPTAGSAPDVPGRRGRGWKRAGSVADCGVAWRRGARPPPQAGRGGVAEAPRPRVASWDGALMGWFDRPEFGPNVGLIDDIYRRYLDDPGSVSPAWREVFAGQAPRGGDGQADRPAEDRPAEDRPAEDRPAEDRPGRQEPAAPPATPGEEQVPLKGIGARIVEAMESSLAVPTATSLRTVPARLLEVNRAILNNHLRRRRGRGGKVSFTHLVGFAVARALAASPGMRATYAEVRGRPHVVRHEHVNLGLAVDVRRDDGTRVLLVPNVKQADTLDFARFLAAYQELLGKVRAGRLTVEDFAGTTVTITNPGTVGTVSSVPRLLSGQAAIVGVGAIDYPVEYQGADPARLAEIGIGKVLTLTSTYDHRVIQGAESGEFLARVHRLLLGEDGFYDGVFAAMGVPYVPVRWRPDDNPDDRLSAIEKQARVLQLINMYRVRGHLLADLDPLEAKPPRMPEELDPATFGFTIWDLNRRFVTGGLAGRRELELGEILSTLRDAYCRTATCEYMHISDPAQKHWIQERMEAMPDGIDAGDQERILYKLGEAEAFERFLHGKYTGHKRFSLEGAETLIPMLDALLDEAADAGVVEVVMGMSHRGRLNVLANTIGKSYAEIFHEFEGDIDPAHTESTGDGKYHPGQHGQPGAHP